MWRYYYPLVGFALVGFALIGFATKTRLAWHLLQLQHADLEIHLG
jgi:hypothetical protein